MQTTKPSRSSPSPQPHPILDDNAIQEIEFRAAVIGQQLGLSYSDADDLRQEMALGILQKANGYERGMSARETFVGNALDWTLRGRGEENAPSMLDIDELTDEEMPVTNDPRQGELGDFDLLNLVSDVNDVRRKTSTNWPTPATMRSRALRGLAPVRTLVSWPSCTRAARTMRTH